MPDIIVYSQYMEPEEITMAFVSCVKRLMEAKGITQRELAKALSVNEANVSRLLSGRHYPTAPTIAAVATYFNVPAHELIMTPTETPKPKKKK